MSSLEDVYDGGSRWWAVARAVFLLVGSLVATVGFVAATASLVAGFGLGKAGALKVSSFLGGVLLLGAFLVLFARGATRGRSRTLAVVGAVFGVVGLTLFWTTLPSGWTGHLAALPPIALGAYAAGLLAVFAAEFAGDSTTDGPRADATEASGTETGSFGSVELAATSATERDAGPASAVGDGGENDEDLQFFDDDS
jgi:ABC-type transport system involved in multi-copper enzyme maturation permease subunit